MSMISEQVADLREKAQIFEVSGCATNGIVKTFREAADTIEELSTKLATANMERSTAYRNGGWIPCKDELPKESGYYQTTIMWSGQPTLHRGFYNAERKRWSGQSYDPVAWLPRPEPYKGVE